jgi:deazaflavin-dependent oxidoreductase (nitroreductase family)
MRPVTGDPFGVHGATRTEGGHVRQGSAVNTRRYIKPPFMQRHVGNRMSVLFQPSRVLKLSVRGRRSGRWHTTPVAVLDHDGERYLVSYRGASDWARNLEASHNARLTQRGRTEEIDVAGVPVPERAELLDVYRDRYSKMPTVGSTLDALPEPADHPMFRIIASRPTA